MENYIITAFDLGTNMTSLVMGMYDESEPYSIKIIAMDSQPSLGIQRGMVLNPETTAKIVTNLELGADRKIKKNTQYNKSYCVNINGLSYRTEQITHSMQIPSGMTISDTMIRKFTDDAKAKSYVNDDVKLISFRPICYSIDNSPEIINPIGRNGSAIEGKFLATFAMKGVVEGLNTMCKKGVDQIFTTAYAKSVVLLHPEDKNAGSMLVDFGASTTSIAIFSNNTLRHEVSIPFGSQLITNDIAHGLNVSMDIAENLKRNISNFVNDELESQSKTIEIRYDDNNIVKFEPEFLMYIIKARLEEIIHYIDVQVTKSATSRYIKKIVITGGGAKLIGITKALEEHFGKPTIIADPHSQLESDLIHQYAGAIGMASLYARENRDNLIERQPTLFSNVEEEKKEEVVEEKKPEDEKPEKPKKGGFIKNFIKNIENSMSEKTSFPDE